LCNPITRNVTKELVGFTANVPESVYASFDWEHMTTIIVTDCTELISGSNCIPWDPKFVCYAHQRGVRVIRWPLHGYSKELLVNYTARDDWVKEQAQITLDRYWDGINLDWELGMSANSLDELLLTEFVNDVVTVFRIILPEAKLSFDVPFAPNYPGPNGTVSGDCVFGRCFNYTALASILDYLFVMDYDIYVFKLAHCSAVANSPLPYVANGVKQFTAAGVDPRKLILGFPWYGYYYRYCIQPPNVTKCPLPFYSSKVCMIDQSRYEVMYSAIESYFIPLIESVGGGRGWHEESASPYIWWYDETHSNLHHVWYDNSTSLRAKIKSVESYPVNVLGIGIFALSEIDNSNMTQVNDMWGPFVEYVEGNN